MLTSPHMTDVRPRWILLLAAVCLFCAMAGDAQARRPRKEHVVQQGESIARIADQYGVSQRDLRELNRLKPGQPLSVGRTLLIPNVLRIPGTTYVVKDGDTLASIAARFHCTVKNLAHANKLGATDALTVGRTLVIPDGETGSTAIRVKGRTIVPVSFVRVRTGDRDKLHLYSKARELNRQAVARLSWLARDKVGDKVYRLNYRLIALIQQISEKFPGSPIEIISGYRAQADGQESQHAFGRAMDLRIPGVPGRQIFQFCRSLDNAGCGYYPKSGFVHVDAREKPAFWIDNSP